ncbi:MAG TPA: universal stress protein, partial [Rhizobiales bacterium]|nr:universal stress protein [Hyphomicrobiales bacterium]
AKELGVRTVKTELEFEHPAKAILDAARRKDVDMIVMGRKGHNRIAEFFLGSTAQHVIQHAERSVLMVA